MRAWLGCLALCLAGEDIYDEDEAPLHDTSIRLGRTTWCVAEIDSLLDELKTKQDTDYAVTLAMNIHQKFLEHYDEKPIRMI